MRFAATALPGVVEVLAEPAFDPRGAFLRSWSRAEFAAAGIDFAPIEISLSENTRRHTLRGMHFQAAPAGEAKLVRCLRGAVHDVALDLRAESPAYRRSVAILLSAEQRNAVFIPRGCAHGFLTLTDDAVLEYMIDAPHAPGLARGVRWDDPAFGIAWPAAPVVISDRDQGWPDHG
ncbi:dTDP-4-dehydrorhamnose 3,5-epimerase family protein [Roseomonas sp. CECT 9278]|uniref:dTDP-4-dehydrorhamnose 3,5-epimerase family protein n=1 Tax=Roseomonas sp. CECT 9278 TaxID=2845823 RepID=UPI001E4BDB46|nr:dTDP-4-dehydrorhamnose 3,5-epimerase family protein [Roseomonas sp. CECT 9278]CAH0220738.1 dTDP-4-dehydrorhamnose 3,5-epimerase [Roseomonas sp. CECT 9278]